MAVFYWVHLEDVVASKESIEFNEFYICNQRRRWTRNALWELVNERHQNHSVFGLGEWQNYPMRLSFAVCGIRGEPKFLLEDKLLIRDNKNVHTYDKQVAQAIGRESTTNLHICERWVGRTFACLEVN